MTKEELRHNLLAFGTLGECFDFRVGQECEIFKADKFKATDQIIYIPDVDLNRLRRYIDNPIYVDSPPAWMDECESFEKETIDEIINCCYTGNDFLKECGGDFPIAERLFEYCDWQHPSSALPEIEEEDE